MLYKINNDCFSFMFVFYIPSTARSVQIFSFGERENVSSFTVWKCMYHRTHNLSYICIL